MTLPKSGWWRAVASLIVIGAAAGITLGVTTLLGVTFGDEASQPASAGSGDGRNPLAICVQAVEYDASGKAVRGDSASETDAKSRVEAAAAAVQDHPYRDIAGIVGYEPVVDVGCPSLPPEPQPPHTRFRLGNIFGREVQEPGPYALSVFVLPRNDFERLLGTSIDEVSSPGLRRATQEVVCERHGDFEQLCGEVSTGLYVTEEELGDSGFLAAALERALGLGKRP